MSKQIPILNSQQIHLSRGGRSCEEVGPACLSGTTRLWWVISAAYQASECCLLSDGPPPQCTLAAILQRTQSSDSKFCGGAATPQRKSILQSVLLPNQSNESYTQDQFTKGGDGSIKLLDKNAIINRQPPVAARQDTGTRTQ